MNLVETSHCPVCGGTKVSHKISKYLVCADCTLIYVPTMPSDLNLNTRIDKWGRQNIQDNHKEKKIFRQYEYRRFALLKQYTTEKNLLDVGCGSGRFLRFVRMRGYEVTGIDKSKVIIKHLKQQKIPAHTSITQIRSNSFAIVTCFDTIEHTPDPIKLLKQIRRVIKKSGYLLITTPNNRGISAHILNKYWWVFAPDDHLVMFNVQSLQVLLQKCHFVIIDVKTDTLTQWFHLQNVIISKLLNKIVYIILLPMRNYLFKTGKGDNVQILAQKR